MVVLILLQAFVGFKRCGVVFAVIRHFPLVFRGVSGVFVFFRGSRLMAGGLRIVPLPPPPLDG